MFCISHPSIFEGADGVCFELTEMIPGHRDCNWLRSMSVADFFERPTRKGYA